MMHQAHKRVGVPGAAFFPYRPFNGSEKGVVRVLLVSDPDDPVASAALKAFEPIVARQRDLEYDRAVLDAVYFGESINADCFAVFARGLHVFSRGAVFDPKEIVESISDSDFTHEAAGSMRVVPSAPWHPVLDRVCSFEANMTPWRLVPIPETALGLLFAKTDAEEGDCRFLAWADESPVRRFHTLLGLPEDFRRPDFVQMALNAIEWAGC